MEFVRCDPNIHDLDTVSTLIYDTEPFVFSLFFGKNKKKGLARIKRLVKAGSNSFGHDVIYLAVEDDQILGLTIFYTGKDINEHTEYQVFSQELGNFGVLRLWFYEKILIGRLLTMTLDEYDLYISNICVDEHYRGRGVGKFLLHHILQFIKQKQVNRILLDVSSDNKVAISLYEKNGFHINRVNTSRFWKIKIFQMINIDHIPSAAET
jgi:ribosomal protein S18 acetylase RimI-like enzyme